MEQKNSKLVKLTAAAMALCLAVGCVVGGTLAKYTTQDSAADVARVAKWGVDLQLVGNLYGDSYKQSLVLDNNKTLNVQSADKKTDLVAPGTKNDDGFSIRLNGTPEVNYELISTITAQNIFLNKGQYGLMVAVKDGLVTKANFDEFAENKSEGDCPSGLWYKDGTTFKPVTAFTAGTQYFTLEDYVAVSDNYFPVVYALSGSGVSGEETVFSGDNSKDTINLIAEKLAEQLKGEQLDSSDKSTDAKNITTFSVKSIVYGANTDIAKNVKLSGEKITWAWEFDKNAATSGNADEEDCKADTILGLLMNRGVEDGENLSSDCTVVKMNQSGNGYAAPVEHTDFCLDTQFSIDITASQSAESATVEHLDVSSVAGVSEGLTTLSAGRAAASGNKLVAFIAANKSALPAVKYGQAMDLSSAYESFGAIAAGANTAFEIVEIDSNKMPVAFGRGDIVINEG